MDTFTPFNILFISATLKLKRAGPRIDLFGTPKFVNKMLEMFESIMFELNPNTLLLLSQ